MEHTIRGSNARSNKREKTYLSLDDAFGSVWECNVVVVIAGWKSNIVKTLHNVVQRSTMNYG